MCLPWSICVSKVKFWHIFRILIFLKNNSYLITLLWGHYWSGWWLLQWCKYSQAVRVAVSFWELPYCQALLFLQSKVAMEEPLLFAVRFLFSGVWFKAASFLIQQSCAVESVGSLGKQLCSWAGWKQERYDDPRLALSSPACATQSISAWKWKQNGCTISQMSGSL